MKKMIFILVTAMLCTMTMNAQSALELAKEQRKLNEINAKMLNLKPTKDAKKQARQLKKAGESKQNYPLLQQGMQTTILNEKIIQNGV